MKLDYVVVLIRLGSFVIFNYHTNCSQEGSPALNIWQPTRWVGHICLLWRPGWWMGSLLRSSACQSKVLLRPFWSGIIAPNGGPVAECWYDQSFGAVGWNWKPHISCGRVKEGEKGAFYLAGEKRKLLQVHYLDSWIRSITGNGDKDESL